MGTLESTFGTQAQSSSTSFRILKAQRNTGFLHTSSYTCLSGHIFHQKCFVVVYREGVWSEQEFQAKMGPLDNSIEHKTI
jgi:hypothetical protein